MSVCTAKQGAAISSCSRAYVYEQQTGAQIKREIVFTVFVRV